MKSILQYNMQFDSTSHDAFSIVMIGSMSEYQVILRIIPHIIKKYTNIEKYFLANCRFFSQRVLEINALHQLPTINHIEAITIITGKVRFTAVNASLPT